MGRLAEGPHVPQQRPRGLTSLGVRAEDLQGHSRGSRVWRPQIPGPTAHPQRAPADPSARTTAGVCVRWLDPSVTPASLGGRAGRRPGSGLGQIGVQASALRLPASVSSPQPPPWPSGSPPAVWCHLSLSQGLSTLPFIPNLCPHRQCVSSVPAGVSTHHPFTHHLAIHPYFLTSFLLCVFPLLLPSLVAVTKMYLPDL